MYLQIVYYKRNRHHLYEVLKIKKNNTFWVNFWFKSKHLRVMQDSGVYLQSPPLASVYLSWHLLPGSLRAPSYLHNLSPNPLPSTLPLPCLRHWALLPLVSNTIHLTTQDHKGMGSESQSSFVKGMLLGSGVVVGSLKQDKVHILKTSYKLYQLIRKLIWGTGNFIIVW